MCQVGCYSLLFYTIQLGINAISDVYEWQFVMVWVSTEQSGWIIMRDFTVFEEEGHSRTRCCGNLCTVHAACERYTLIR